MESFEGIQIHSHDYKEPLIFRNKNVVVIGAGPSGLDISTQISGHANKVGSIFFPTLILDKNFYLRYL